MANCADVDAWAAHFREVLRFHGFDINPELERALAQRVVEENSNRRAVEERRERRRQATATRQGEVLAHLMAGRERADALRLAGVGIETFNRWRRNDAAFRVALNDTLALAVGRSSRSQRSVRPAKMTSGVRDQVISLLASGKNRSEAARAAGISRQTLYAWLRRLPEFSSAVTEAENRAALARMAVN